MSEITYYIIYRTYNSIKESKLCKGEYEEGTVEVVVYNTDTSDSGSARNKFNKSLSSSVRARTNIVNIFC